MAVPLGAAPRAIREICVSSVVFSTGEDRSCSYARIMLFVDTPIAGPRWGAEMQLSDRIGRRMKLHDLHVLMAVVQAGSMNKAAALLNTGQSAISRSIAELEHTI